MFLFFGGGGGRGGVVIFCLTFVIKGVPGRFSLSGGCSGVFRGVLRVFRECSGPVPVFTDTQRFTLSRAQSLLSRAVSRVWPVNNEFKSD